VPATRPHIRALHPRLPSLLSPSLLFIFSLAPPYLLDLSILVITSWCDSVFHFLRRSFYVVLSLGKFLLLPPLSWGLEICMENNVRCLYWMIWHWEQTAFILRAATRCTAFWIFTIRSYLSSELEYKPVVVYLSSDKPRGMISSKINPNLAGHSSALSFIVLPKPSYEIHFPAINV